MERPEDLQVTVPNEYPFDSYVDHLNEVDNTKVIKISRRDAWAVSIEAEIDMRLGKKGAYPDWKIKVAGLVAPDIAKMMQSHNFNLIKAHNRAAKVRHIFSHLLYKMHILPELSPLELEPMIQADSNDNTTRNMR